MANWWQSILERVLQIKAETGDWAQDVLFALIVLFVGISAFGLGRLSNYEDVQPAVRLFDAETDTKEPISIGGLFVASKNGSKYHFPWCSSARTMNEANKIWFASIEEARSAGYSPAGNCKGLK
ncbi:hypothetical protein JXR01_01205 [Candidatus Kaiserbacteria bacterium]|nr:MAG: hypothetical protein JXR01_01205 [Candidatus Kaiserbacteria bacterium]